MDFGQAVLAIIKSLPEIISFVKKMGESIGGLIALARDKQVNDWLDGLNKATSDLKNATTLRDRINAAKRLNDLSSGM